MSKIIMPDDIQHAEMIAKQEVAQEAVHEQMFGELIKIVTRNVIGSLMNAPMGIVYYDSNNEVVSKEQSIGFTPERQNELDSGYDVKSPESFELAPGARYTLGLKIGVLLPSWMDIFVLPRSGLANKLGITVVNSPGLIDANYAGYELKVIFLNTGTEVWKVKKGDRVAQLRFQMKGATMYMESYNGTSNDLKDLQSRISRQGGMGSTGSQ